MTPEETLNAIINHRLAIRQIPLEITSLHSLENFQPGNTIVELKIAYDASVANPNKNNPAFRFDHKNRVAYRKFAKQTKTPKHAGYWMCKQSPTNTSSRMAWLSAKDNCAPTLTESVEMFLSTLQPQ